MMKPSPPNRPVPILRWKAMPIADASSRAEERVLLANQLTAERFQIHCENLARVRRRECNALLALGLVLEHRHEQAFTGQDALAGAEERVEHAFGRAAAVAEDRFHLDAGRHVHERSRFSDGRLARVEFHLDELHLVAVNHEVDVVGPPPGQRRRRGRSRSLGLAEIGSEGGHVLHLLPRRHAGGEYQRLGINAAVAQVRDNLVLSDGADLVTADRHVPL